MTKGKRGNDKEERGNDKREEVGIIRGNRTARKKLEKRLGRSVISNENYLKNPEKKKRLGK